MLARPMISPQFNQIIYALGWFTACTFAFIALMFAIYIAKLAITSLYELCQFIAQLYTGADAPIRLLMICLALYLAGKFVAPFVARSLRKIWGL
jgi:hypothetical protein